MQASSRDVAASPTHEAQDRDAVAGVWRAQMDGLPAVTLNVTYETGSLNGAILFYLHLRHPGQPVTSSPGVPEPLIDPKFDGITLSFAVSHKRAHPPASLDTPPVHFTLRLTGPGRGELTNESEPSPKVEVLRDHE
ncbi:MAG TPA: hypothetical protein VLZ50_08230 [Terracidiphilus sp.]|nr:hypothetical protein [Terracidiphilus sp.]